MSKYEKLKIKTSLMPNQSQDKKKIPCTKYVEDGLHIFELVDELGKKFVKTNAWTYDFVKIRNSRVMV